MTTGTVHTEQYIALELGLKRMVSKNLLVRTVTIEDLGDVLLFDIRAFVWGQTDILGGPREFSYPDGWVEAFKARWLSAWMRRRWPVRMKVVTVRPWLVYPELLHYPEPGMRRLRLEVHENLQVTADISEGWKPT